MNKRKGKIYTEVLMYNLALIIVVMIFYYLIPIFLNYPPNSINNDFERLIDMGMKYREQYIIVVIATIVVSNELLFREIRKIKNLIDANVENNNYDKLVRNCFMAPRKIISYSCFSTSSCNNYNIMAYGCRYFSYS